MQGWRPCLTFSLSLQNGSTDHAWQVGIWSLLHLSFGWLSVLQGCWHFGNTHALVPVLESDKAHLPILGPSCRSCIKEAKGGNGFVLMLTWLSMKIQVLLPLCFSIWSLHQEPAWEGEEERAEMILGM